MDREFGILQRRIAKSGPKSHFALSRFDALRQIVDDLPNVTDVDSSGVIRSYKRRLDALEQEHPELRAVSPRIQRTIDRAALIKDDLWAEILGPPHTSELEISGSKEPEGQPIKLSGVRWQMNRHPGRAED